MEVVGDTENKGFALWHLLDAVCPFAGNLHGGFNRLGTSVHRQYHIVAKCCPNFFCPHREDIVVKSARTQGQTAGLLGERLDELRVAVALVDSAIGRKKVEVVLAFWVPDIDALRARKDDWKRVVVVGGATFLGGYGLLGGGGVEVAECADTGRAGVVCVGSHCGEWL